MNLTLYRNNAVSCACILDEKTTVKRRLMVENTIAVSVAVPKDTPLDVRMGDYADINSERYVVLDMPSYKLSNGVYDYSILLRGNVHRLELYMMPDEGRDEWFYYGGPIQHIDKVVAVLNTKEPGWSAVYPDLSDLPDASAKNLNYANMSILSALHAVASTENGWGLEFDITGKVIRFARQIKTPTTLRFEYGRGMGLYELTRGERSDERLATRVVAYGATTNMPGGFRLSMAPVNDQKDYIDRRTDLFGLRETRINYDHIYPRRNASITTDAVQVEAGKAHWSVRDATLDFDLDIQAAEGAVLLFTTGDCVGVEFEIVHYDPATQTITFKEVVDEHGGVDGKPYIMPNADRKPQAGNAYVLVNILMPDSYVASAQRELKAAAEADAERLSGPQYSYSVACDPRFIRALPHRPAAGDACRIVDAPHGVDYTTRIVGLEYPLIDPTRVKLTLAETVPIPSAVVLAKSIKEVKTKLGLLDRGQLTEAQLRKIFHPLGGNMAIDFSARDIVARNATVEDNVKAKHVFASVKLISPFVSSPEFLAAMLGYGFGMYVDENGESHLWADHLHGRVSFETLEMRYRKLLVSGEDLLVSSGGVVEEVLPYGQTFLTTPDGRTILTQDRRPIYWPSNGRVVFRLKGEPGIDLRQFDTDDILRYTWRDTKTGNAGASGWLRVKHCFDTFWFEAEVVSGSPEWLKKGMTVGQFGNYTKKDRQGFINLSARDKHIAIWDEVDDHVLAPSMLKAYLGDLRYVTDPRFPEMSGFGLYSQNAFLKGVFVLRSSGQTIETEFAVRDKEISSRVKSGDFETYKTQTDKEISSRVKSGDFETYKTQTDKEISSRVTKIFVDPATGKQYDVESILKQTPEEILLQAGLINLQGLVKSEKIDVDSLVARNIDTRSGGKIGVQITQHQTALTAYDINGIKRIELDGGIPAEGNTSGVAGLFVRSPDSTYDGHWFYGEKGVRFLSKQTGVGNNAGVDMSKSGLSFNKWGSGGSGYPMARIGINGITLHNTATVDMPGVLCAGRVAKTNGRVDSQWGCKTCRGEKSNGEAGKYKLTHDIKHMDYYVTANIASDGFVGSVVVLEKTTTYVVLGVGGLDGGFWDNDFDFMLCGKN